MARHDIFAGAMLGIFVASIVRKPEGRRLVMRSAGLYILVQTKPDFIILASSSDKAELEMEMAELNETVNNVHLREDRHAYAISHVPAPLVSTKKAVQV